MKTYPISKSEAVQKVLDELTGPTPLEEIIDQVLELWPSRAKNRRNTIKQEIRYHSGKTIVFPDRETVAHIWSLLDGVRFRVLVTPQEAEEGWLSAGVLHPLLPLMDESLKALRFVDGEGKPLPMQVITATVQMDSPFGPYEAEMPVFDLRDWLASQNVKAGDSILVTILDRRIGHLVMEHEPADQRQEEIIARQNQELADLIYDLVFNYSMREPPVTQVIPTAYARLSNPQGYPGDHWADVVKEDYRLQLGLFNSISLSIHKSAFSYLEEDQDPTWPIPLSPQQEELARERESKVYRFKAAFKHRKGLWRRLEILGSHTLGDLDDMMRDAFEHDWSDHLSEFSLLIGGRHRPVGLGSIEPFGGGEGREPLVSHLGLALGDKLEYLYDFGDCIKHRLTLEAIEEPEESIEYPRQVGQNKPRYRNCVHCEKQGNKTVATCICLECSNEEQRPVLVCESCLSEYHADHYVDELLY